MAPSTAPFTLRGWILLTRPGCHLCDEFVDQLTTAFPRFAVAVESADVDSRDDWREQFGRLIPVLLDRRGEAVCITDFDRRRLALALAAESRD